MSPYAVAKRAGELYLDYYAALHGLGTVVLRYANVYGSPPDSSTPRPGWWPSSWTAW